MVLLHKLLVLILVVFSVDCTILETGKCLTPGRFRHRDPLCTKYFLCVRMKDSLVVQNYICPPTTVFNPSTNRCSVQAHCIEEICKNLPSTVTKIPDPNAKECLTYIECQGTEDRYPEVKKCDVGYFNKDLPVPGCWFFPSC